MNDIVTIHDPRSTIHDWKRLALSVVVAGWVLLTGRCVWAEDTVYFSDPAKKTVESITGTVEHESPTGIKLRVKGGVRDIPALQITQITYGNTIVDAITYREPEKNLGNALRETKAARRAELLRLALLGYQDLEVKLRDMPHIRRYLQFKIAQATALQARDDPSRLDPAIAALTEYKGAYPTGWEIVPALQSLARVQEDKGDMQGASKTYAELAAVPGISEAMKLENQLLEARLLVRGNKFADAERKLKALAAVLPKDASQRTAVDLYLAQSQMAQGRLDGVEAKLRATILASKDKSLLALAHNFLGDFYRLKKQEDLAFWEYLRVDMMYSEDKEEHSKALYYLSQLFDRPRNDPVRAEQYLTKLKSKEYDGTTYQRKAEKKTP
jgi:hypothetical protein